MSPEEAIRKPAPDGIETPNHRLLDSIPKLTRYEPTTMLSPVQENESSRNVTHTDRHKGQGP